MKKITWIILFSLTLPVLAQEETKALNPEFVHVVLFWLNDPQDESNTRTFEKNLETLLLNSKHTLTNFVGTPPKASREVVDDSFDYMLIVSFPSASEQEAYQGEQAHLDFIEATKQYWSNVVVYDAQGKIIKRK